MKNPAYLLAAKLLISPTIWAAENKQRAEGKQNSEGAQKAQWGYEGLAGPEY